MRGHRITLLICQHKRIYFFIFDLVHFSFGFGRTGSRTAGLFEHLSAIAVPRAGVEFRPPVELPLGCNLQAESIVFGKLTSLPDYGIQKAARCCRCRRCCCERRCVRYKLASLHWLAHKKANGQDLNSGRQRVFLSVYFQHTVLHPIREQSTVASFIGGSSSGN